MSDFKLYFSVLIDIVLVHISVSSKRKRKTISTLNSLLSNSEDEHSVSMSSEADSEDEWALSKKKKGDKHKQKIQPVRTLKKKLAEKMKNLKKCVESISTEIKSQKEAVTINFENNKIVDKVVNSERDSIDIQNNNDEIDQKFDLKKNFKLSPEIPKIEQEFQIQTKQENTDIKIEEKSKEEEHVQERKDSTISNQKCVTDIVKSDQCDESVIVLSDDDENDESPPENKLVVVNCSITKTHASPLLAASDSSLHAPITPLLSPPSLTSSVLLSSPISAVESGNIVSTALLPTAFPVISPSYIASSQVQTSNITLPFTASQTPTFAVNSIPHSTPSPVPRIRINPTYQVSPVSNNIYKPITETGSPSALLPHNIVLNSISEPSSSTQIPAPINVCPVVSENVNVLSPSISASPHNFLVKTPTSVPIIQSSVPKMSNPLAKSPVSHRRTSNSNRRISNSAPASRSGSLQNSTYKPRKLFSPRTPNVSAPVRTNVTLRKSPAYRTSNRSATRLNSSGVKNTFSLNRISPNSATVIRSGSNSVTITPRKKSPERPPVQRKLFKNEIEGVIAVRSEDGVLKYVLNLANGTHMPLTNLQVRKLREQNNGTLPKTLKIPVPSDVAAKIEPSFLIED